MFYGPVERERIDCIRWFLLHGCSLEDHFFEPKHAAQIPTYHMSHRFNNIKTMLVHFCQISDKNSLVFNRSTDTSTFWPELSCSGTPMLPLRAHSAWRRNRLCHAHSVFLSFMYLQVCPLASFSVSTIWEINLETNDASFYLMVYLLANAFASCSHCPTAYSYVRFLTEPRSAINHSSGHSVPFFTKMRWLR